MTPRRSRPSRTLSTTSQPTNSSQSLAHLIAAILEAALAAVYLEHGFEAVEPAIVAEFDSVIQFALTSQVDPKSELQEVLARSGRSVTYALPDAVGPAHDRTFTAAVVIDGEE